MAAALAGVVLVVGAFFATVAFVVAVFFAGAAVAGAPTAATTEECRPGTQRYLTLEVQDGPAGGLLAVAYLPPGPTPEPPPGSVAARTASGGTVIVSSGPPDGTVPPPL